MSNPNPQYDEHDIIFKLKEKAGLIHAPCPDGEDNWLGSDEKWSLFDQLWTNYLNQ
jgi:hypothetical protein